MLLSCNLEAPMNAMYTSSRIPVNFCIPPTSIRVLYVRNFPKKTCLSWHLDQCDHSARCISQPLSTTSLQLCICDVIAQSPSASWNVCEFGRLKTWRTRWRKPLQFCENSSDEQVQTIRVLSFTSWHDLTRYLGTLTPFTPHRHNTIVFARNPTVVCLWRQSRKVITIRVWRHRKYMLAGWRRVANQATRSKYFHLEISDIWKLTFRF